MLVLLLVLLVAAKCGDMVVLSDLASKIARESKEQKGTTGKTAKRFAGIRSAKLDTNSYRSLRPSKNEMRARTNLYSLSLLLRSTL